MTGKKCVLQKTQCFSSANGPVAYQTVKSSINHFGGLWHFFPSKTNTGVDSRLVGVKNTNYNWDASIAGRDNSPYLRSNVVGIAWFQVWTPGGPSVGLGFAAKFKPLDLRKQPFLHGQPADKVLLTVCWTLCTISWCGLVAREPSESLPSPGKRGLCPLFPQAALNVSKFRLVIT